MTLDETTRNAHGIILSPGRVESEGETDFYWTEEAKQRATRCVDDEPMQLVSCMQGEAGFGSFLALSGVCGDVKPAANIMSKLHSAEAFNTVPEPLCPSWLLYEIGENTLALRLTHWFPLNADAHGNPHAWLYSYPVIRDTLKIILRNYNVEQMHFLTTNALTRFIDNEAEGFIKMQPGELVVYDFNSEAEISNEVINGDLVLTTPAWGFPYIFSKMVPKGLSNVVCAGADENSEGMIDYIVVATLSQYCNSCLDLDIDKEKQGEVIDVLMQVDEEIKAEAASMLRRFVESTKKSDDIGGMFG